MADFNSSIKRAARGMVENHGARAAAEAEARANRLLETGNSAAAATWQQIATVVREIEASRNSAAPPQPRGYAFVRRGPLASRVDGDARAPGAHRARTTPGP